MTISVVHATAGNSTSVTIPSTTAGNCLVVAVCSENAVGAATVSGVTLGGSGTGFSQLADAAGSGSGFCDAIIWANPNIAGGQTSVVISGTHLNVGTGNGGVVVFEVSGLVTSSVLDKPGTGGGSGSSWSSGATATTTQADEIWIGCADTFNAVTGPSSPWTNTAPTGGFAIAGYQIVSSTGTATYSGTQASSGTYAAAVVTLFGSGTSANVTGAAAQVTVAGGIGTPAGGTPNANVTGVAAQVTVAGGTGTPHGATPAVVNQWAATFAQPAAFGTMPPALESSVIALTPAASVGGGTGTPTSGNWLFCIAGWNQDVLPSATVGDGDDVHSFWRPGDVTASDWAVSPAAGNTRTSIWYTPNLVRAAGDVYCAPSGMMAGRACLVIEVTGLGPWDTVTGIYSSYAAAATSLNLALGAPSAQAFLLGAVTGDSSAVSQAFAPGGWTALSTVTASNGTDHTCDAVLTSACITTLGSVSVNGTTSGASDLSGVVIGVLAAAPSPIPGGANAAWAGRSVLEFAPGCGFETPPDEVTWVTLSDSAWTSTAQGWKRFWGWADKGGIPYALGQLQSGSGAAQLDNFDGNLSPSNPGGTWYSSALNANMSFQSGVSSWTAQNGATLAQSSAQSFASAAVASALYSAQVTPNGSAATPGAISEQEAATAGGAYSASAWFYSTAGYSAGAQVAISWYNSSHTLISTSTATALAIPAATWTQVELLNQAAPALTAYAAITVQFSGTPSATPFWVAEAALVSGASAVSTGQVTTGVPMRLRLALGSYGGVTYNRWYAISRNMSSFSEKRMTTLPQRLYIEAGLTDIWSVASGSCPTPYRGEVELDNPGWWWPCDDQPLAGGVLPVTLRNAATGSSTVLTVEASPGGVSSQDLYSSSYGNAGGGAGTDLTAVSTSANPAVAVYSVAQQAGWMYGDPQVSPQSAQTGNPVTAQPGSAAWQQTGAQGNTGAHGWFLAATDTFPPVANGVTVTGWFNYAFAGTAASIDNSGTYYNVAGQPWCQLSLLELATSSAPVAILYLDTSGHLILETFNGGTGTTHAIYSGSDLRCAAFLRVTVELTQTAYTVWVNGSLTASASGSCTISASAWNWLIANGDLGSGGGSTLSGIQHGGNVAVSHLKVFAGLLPKYRELAQYSAAITGCGLLPAPVSVQVAAVVNQNPTGFTPDGSEYQGSYGSGGGAFAASALAAAVAGSYTSGPSARSAIGGQGFGTPTSFGAAFFVQWTTLAPLVQAFTAASADAETEASACLGAGDSFTSGFGSGASGHGASHVSGGTGASPPTAPSALGDTVAQRTERVMGYGGITYPGRCIDPASLLVQAALDAGGQQLGANVTNMQQSDNGMLFVDSPGNLSYRQRSHLAADTAIWQLGPDVAGGQIPYDKGVTFGNDPQKVYTDVAYTPYSPDGASLAELVPANSAAVTAAQDQYGSRPYQVTSYLQDQAKVQAACNWAFATYGTLRRRAETITVNAASHPAAWGFVAGANLSDVCFVQDMPAGAPLTQGLYRITQMDRRISGGANGSATAATVAVTLDPLPSAGYWS